MVAQNKGDYMKRITTVVSGNIQNVGYRAKVIPIAKAFGLTGFVQNLVDGRVKIIAEGEDSNLDRFLHSIAIKNTLINVEKVEVEHADATGDFAEFSIFFDGQETNDRLDTAAAILKELIHVIMDGFGKLNHATEKSKEQISTLRQETIKFSEDISVMRRDLMGEVEEQISTLRQETMKFGEDLDTMRVDLVGEVGAKILTLRQERRLLFEKNVSTSNLMGN